ncbi:MAG: EAL domain-containing protein [Lachnospiraceae bacterium]|nr:EAL domain-containing protein [Lachnospiraceae bacterium]
MQNNEKKGILYRIKELLGFYTNPPYVEDRLREADVRSATCLAAVVALMEVAMILRFIKKYMLSGIIPWEQFFEKSAGYWELFAASVIIFVYSRLYVKGRLKHTARFSRVVLFLYLSMGMYFGAITTLSDFRKGRMITCFLSMIMFIAIICIWRPFISLLFTLIIGVGFVYYLNGNATDISTGLPIELSEADTINYATYLVSLVVLELSVYYQRYGDAVKSWKLKNAAETDETTGIPNMLWLGEVTGPFIAENMKQGRNTYCLVFDVRNFRTYNGRFGYSGGDKLLKELAGIIVDEFRGDLCARESVDRFAVITAAEDYEDKAIRIRKKLKEARPEERYLDLKTGVYLIHDSSRDVRHAVDHSRYAINHIKDRDDLFIKEYDDKLRSEYKLRKYILNHVDDAVEKGYIKVYYQPVIISEDGKLCGCEALARWIDPDRGFLSPGQFIPVLEEGRQIHKLDRCVYELVCKNIRECFDSGLPALPTSINFSRLDFELMDAVGELERLVEKYQVPKEYIHVEITESALSEDVEGLKAAMDDLHSRGYVIWLDDFGSGYSSMNVLKDFRFDLLKIDMEFMRNFSGNESAHKIVKSIIDLADSLNMMTLTEGVETDDAVEFLRQAHCGRIQGYYYGKPVPYEDLLKMIDEGKLKL